MRITCLIPAFNEEKNIRNMIQTVRSTGFFDEVIVINDGSDDRTAEKMALESGIVAINLAENQGKGGAITAGIEKSTGDLLCMLDADLVGLTKQHIQQLLEPVMEQKADICIGVVTKDKKWRDIGQRAFSVLSGQQCFFKSSVVGADLADTRFGLELALSEHFKKKGLTTEKVILEGVTHTTKEEKMGVGKGLWARVKMYRDILRIGAKTQKNKIKDEMGLGDEDKSTEK
ncbi:MAG: glycosyltransferase family 2 protein [Patescibacteria group bacterium]